MSSVEDVDEDAPQLDSTGIDVRCPGAPLPDNEEERLEVLRALSVLDTEAEVQFDKVTSLGARLFDTPICLVSLVDQKRQWFKSKFGLDADETPRRLAFCAYTILSKSPEVFVVPNAAEDPRFKYNALVTGPPDIRFYAGAPLIYGKVRLGSLCVIDRKPRTFSVQQKSLLADLAALVVRQISDRSELKKIHNYYISSTAHNLRTPLASLQLCLNLLEDTSIRLPAIQSAAIVNMKSLVDVMNWTINRSLSSAKNHVPVMLGVAQLGSFSIARVIKRVKKSLKARQSVKSNVQVSVDSDFGDLIYSDERSVFFALSELAVNAVDYGRGGVVNIHIHHDPERIGFARIDVSDHGPGIQEQLGTLLFEPPKIVRSQSGRSMSTTGGMGLFHVRTHMDKIGGRVSYHNNSSEGCTFSLSFPNFPERNERQEIEQNVLQEFREEEEGGPRSDESEDDTESTEETEKNPEVLPAKTVLKQKEETRILVVEDHGVIRQMMQLRLQREGYKKVDIAENGSIGLRMLKKKAYDLVFMGPSPPAHFLVCYIHSFARLSLKFSLPFSQSRFHFLTKSRITVALPHFPLTSLIHPSPLDFLMPIMNGIECVDTFREWESKERTVFHLFSPPSLHSSTLHFRHISFILVSQ
eukprot:TRINITY_DN284_c0_g1_i8.p1 TRINITY_DN284_c0_g1~~TRINITY_DN284_c0_g1_i8.p1  ORF type:complete len:639 (-),score=117.83 TRINITY_DN284_c0_g1_i8:634-2550(-)